MEQNKTKKLTNKAIAQKGMFDEEKPDAAKKKPTNIPVTKADSVKKADGSAPAVSLCDGAVYCGYFRVGNLPVGKGD